MRWLVEGLLLVAAFAFTFYFVIALAVGILWPYFVFFR